LYLIFIFVQLMTKLWFLWWKIKLQSLKKKGVIGLSKDFQGQEYKLYH
jgi:hypothetical protein